MNPKHPSIFTGLMPHVTAEHATLVWSYLNSITQWKYIQKGPRVQELEHWFSSYTASQSFAVDSGRSALYLALKAAGVTKGDDVIVQAFTCIVVINAILACGARPLYVDITDEFVMNPTKLEAVFTPQTRAVVIQHTFGKLADTDSIMAIAERYGAVCIEDCAHTLGATYPDGTIVGQKAAMAIYSFGSEKIISSARGGILTVSTDSYIPKIKELLAQLKPYSFIDTLRHMISIMLFHTYRQRAFTSPLLMRGIGVLRKLRITFSITTPAEKKGNQPPVVPALMPNVLAHLALTQLQRLEHIASKRQRLAAIYAQHVAQESVVSFAKNEVPLMYPIRHNQATELVAHARASSIGLGRQWADAIVVPPTASTQVTHYIQGSCPHAEQIIQQLVMLPLSQTMTTKDATRVSQVISSL